MPEWMSHPTTIIVGLVTVIGAAFKIARWTGSVDADRGRFDAFMEEVRADIKKILDRLPLPSTTMSGSPLRLTDLGRRISEELDAAALAEQLAPALRDQAEGKDPYSIQELCFEYVRGKYEPPEETELRIRLLAFDNGIDREQVINVIAIELRDRLLTLPDRELPDKRAGAVPLPPSSTPTR